MSRPAYFPNAARSKPRRASRAAALRQLSSYMTAVSRSCVRQRVAPVSSDWPELLPPGAPLCAKLVRVPVNAAKIQRREKKEMIVLFLLEGARVMTSAITSHERAISINALRSTMPTPR